MVLAMLVGGVVLQSTSPAWQSRLDAAAARLGVPHAQCDKAVTATAMRPGSSTPAPTETPNPTPAWHASRAPMVAGNSAGTMGAGFWVPAI
jgi:hypothetical protein